MDPSNRSTNGVALAATSSSSTSGASHAAPPSFGAAANGTAGPAKPVVKRRPGGGITVSKVKRTILPNRGSPMPAAPAPSSSTNGSTAAAKRYTNALPEETRRRVEELRRAKEQQQREEEQRLRPKPSPKRTNSGHAATKKKRKTKRKVQSSDEDEDDLFSSEPSSKQAKAKRGESKQNGESSCYKRLGRFGVAPHYLVPRDLVNTASFPSASTSPLAEAVAPVQSADLLEGKSYGQFFRGLADGEARVRLDYPANGCSEEFVLLVPKDREEYDPISDLLRTVRCIVEFYLTAEQQALFGALDSLETSSAAGSLLSTQGSVSGSATPGGRQRATLSPHAGTAANSREGTPALNGINGAHSVPLSPARSALLTSATAASSPAPTADGAESGDRDTILRSLTKARNRRDGPLFKRAVERFNTTLRSLKETGKVRENVEAMSKRGVSEGIWRCVQEQCYARTVAPRVEELSKYEAFSDNVYGELLPRFMSEIAQLTVLGPKSVFVDLGSGVGNLLIQVALQTGSQAYGCEQMASPAALASAQLAEAEQRWRMWGLQGAEMAAWRGDFGEEERVRDVLRRADVVLVNNYAFTATTNDKLSLLFLDLKDGAHIVSLKPFVPPDFRLTERTLSSPLAILRVAQRLYTSGCVSWADGGGRYYIHTVDRSLVGKFLEQFDDKSAAKAGARKRQWKRNASGGDDDDGDDDEDDDAGDSLED